MCRYEDVDVITARWLNNYSFPRWALFTRSQSWYPFFDNYYCWAFSIFWTHFK